MSPMPNDATKDGGGGPPEAAHLDWDALNDLADDRLDGNRALVARRHVAQCDDCRRAVEAVRSMSTVAATLAQAIDPPPALWLEVARTIAHPPAPQATSLAGGTERAARWRRSPRWLAAAAIVLMALSSAATALYLGRTGGVRPSAVAERSSTGGGESRAGSLSASFVATERAYVTSVAEVEALLAAQRASLSPATIAVIDRALATIDGAIDEARAALLADPANQSIVELLETSYRQKLDLLRRAAEYSPAT